jgi:hypothetical protein
MMRGERERDRERDMSMYVCIYIHNYIPGHLEGPVRGAFLHSEEHPADGCPKGGGDSRGGATGHEISLLFMVLVLVLLV